MDPVHIMPIDDSPWPFDHFTISKHIYLSQLGNDAAAFRK